jgi:hypothetical protein
MRLAVVVMLFGACGGRAFENVDGTGGSGGRAGVGGNSATGGSFAGGAPSTGGMLATGGMPTDVTSCGVNSDCVVRPQSCCGACGAATINDAAAINKDRLADYQAMICRGQGCDACYMPNDPTIVANCRSGFCSLVFLLEEPLTACTIDAECRLRTRDCCECGGNIELDNLIALNEKGLLEYPPLVCDPNSGCQECLPPEPTSAVARCQELRCVVERVTPSP